MKKINAKKFNFSFFLSSRIPVNSLEDAAKKYGGATWNKTTNEIYSNIAKNEYIELYEDNKISIFIPDTIEINKKIDNAQYVEYILNQIVSKYGYVNSIEYGLGSWYSEDLRQVIYDNITIVSINLKEVTDNDIEFFIELAKYIKKTMQQEAVTITINTALCLI